MPVPVKKKEKDVKTVQMSAREVNDSAAKATNVHRAMKIRIENRKMLLQKTQSPDEYGDNPHETGSIPMEYVSGKCWLVVVQGDSMRDYDLHEGDRLLVRTQDVARSGEIVVAHYDGGPTVKTYFEDEDGSKWLTPGNDKYVWAITTASPKAARRTC